MKLLRLGPVGNEKPVVIQDDMAYDVSQLVDDYDSSFWNGGGVEHLHAAVTQGRASVFDAELAAVRTGPPIARPGKVVCIGLNYSDHVLESGAETPVEPVVFMKPPNTVVGPHDDIRIPPDSVKTDYEVELTVVIGETCRYLASEAAAMRAIAGYAISNDVSERSFQLERGGQWVKGKSFETFNPLGPYVVTKDEIPDPQSLEIRLTVNGEPRQVSNTSRMIFSVAHIVWYLSQFMVLEPGDLINTGTPAGVGLGMDPPCYLKPGDWIEASIAGLGTQRVRCVEPDYRGTPTGR